MRFVSDERGQGVVEAAVAIPVLFLLLLLLLQPGIILYDRLVMANAAAEGCRLLATATGDMGGSCEAFVRHRLAAVPQHDCFHVHQGDCSWNIELLGDESSQEVTVSIENELRPLPLFDAGSMLLGLANANGNLEIAESVTMRTQPDWVTSSELGLDPSSWIGAWLS
ncbi:MAG: pilus assembly protein [Eggerthellaceae bacterium]|nr:pilus assembly protein [Eggerthellaceae bacterium]